jgi:hypothetical protein
MILRKTTATIFAALTLLIFAEYYPVSAQDRGSGAFYGMPAGTVIRVRMDNEINSESSDPGDTFTVTVSDPVEVDGQVVLIAGTLMEGRILEVERASAGRKNGRLEIIFETLFLDAGLKRSIDGSILRQNERKPGSGLGILTAIGAAAVGAVIGAVAKAEKGALIGAGIGGGAGIGAVLLRKGSVLRIPAGDEFGVRLNKPVPLPAKGY